VRYQYRTMKRSARSIAALLLLLAAMAVVAQAGSLQHLHLGGEAGVYNAEHDLTLLATLAGHGLPTDGAPTPAFDVVTTSVPPLVPERPAPRLASSGDSRAPPSA
jgi:hypothetical protein